MSECQCVHGTCDDGIDGTGSCDCDSGFSGKTCDNREYRLLLWTRCDDLFHAGYEIQFTGYSVSLLLTPLYEGIAYRLTLSYFAFAQRCRPNRPAVYIYDIFFHSSWCRTWLHKFAVTEARRTWWNKTEIKQNCRWSGLRFSRPSTVLFYFTFTMWER